VVAQLQQLAAGRLLLGHGLAKDLAALGMSHPQHLMFDTMTHPAFCNKVGGCLAAVPHWCFRQCVALEASYVLWV
jgi:hypothetical protein